jgi:hypothetical protein
VLGACAAARSPSPTASSPVVDLHAASILAANRIEVEIDWLPGCRPAPATLAGVEMFLTEYVAPAGGVHVLLDEEIARSPDGHALAPGDAVSDTDWWHLAGAHRNVARGPGVASIYLLFVSSFPPEELRLRRGLAYPGSGFAVIARDTLRGEAFLTVRGDEIERFVVQHEIGHLLGLVSDDAHEYEGHCTDPRCILYAGVDLRALLANWWRVFTGRLPDSLDAACRRELALRRAQALARVSRCASETEASPTSNCAMATAPRPRSENPTPPPASAT